MTQLLSPAAARPRWRSALATLALVSALFAAGGAAPASADVVGTGPGTVVGTVTATGGAPIPGAFVNISQPFGQGTAFSASTWADSAGHFEFTGLELGSYSLQVNVSGSPTTWQDVTLTSDSPSVAVSLVVASYPTGIGTISGHVTGDGVPLAGVQINATNFSSGQGASTVSDASGYYEFTDLANGNWALFVWGGSQYQPLNPPYSLLTDASHTAVVDLPFVSWPVGTASINGVVTDAATGEPIAGASISVYSDDAPHQSNASTDGAGVFSAELLPAGTYFLHFSANGYLFATSEVHVLAGQAVSVDQALYATNATISGHVEGEDGAPAPGLYIDAHTQDGSIGSAFTDENGDFVLSNLGAVPYTLALGGPGTPFDYQSRVVTPVANGDVTANFTMVKRTTAYLTGFVLGQDGEWFQSPVCVTLYSAKNKKPLGSVATFGPDFGDGTFIFENLKPGSYTLEFKDCDDDPATKFDKVFLGGVKNFKDATFVTLVAGQDSYDNSVTLTPRK